MVSFRRLIVLLFSSRIIITTANDYVLFATDAKCPFDETRIFKENKVTLEECYTHCYNQPACEYFTYGVNAGRHQGLCMGCEKTAYPLEFFHANGMNTFELLNFKEFSYILKDLDQKCPYTDERLLTTSTSTRDECYDLCQNTPYCGTFSYGEGDRIYHKNENFCFLCKTGHSLEYHRGFTTYDLKSHECVQGPLAELDETHPKFGSYLALWENVMVVGTFYGGNAWVYVNNGASWDETQELPAPNGVYDVAISENFIVVADIWNQAMKGVVEVFKKRTKKGWTHTQSLEHGQGNDQFGASVDISDEFIVVGSPYEDTSAIDAAGSVLVFELATVGATVGMWEYQTTLLHPVGQSGAYFGNAVAIWMNTIVVGASRYDMTTDGDQGSAVVFIPDGLGSWSVDQVLSDPNGVDAGQFGMSVAIWESTIIVGVGPYHSGAAFIYEKNLSGDWYQKQKLVDPSGQAHNNFGSSVAIYDNKVLVGAHGLIGSAHVFVEVGGDFEYNSRLSDPNGSSGNYYGYSVDLWGDTVAVGANPVKSVFVGQCVLAQ